MSTFQFLGGPATTVGADGSSWLMLFRNAESMPGEAKCIISVIEAQMTTLIKFNSHFLISRHVVSIARLHLAFPIYRSS
jgi:hypothetical protein